MTLVEFGGSLRWLALVGRDHKECEGLKNEAGECERPQLIFGGVPRVSVEGWVKVAEECVNVEEVLRQ